VCTEKPRPYWHTKVCIIATSVEPPDASQRIVACSNSNGTNTCARAAMPMISVHLHRSQTSAKYKLDHEFGRDHLQLAGSFYITHPETNSLAIGLIDPFITMTVMRPTDAGVRLSQMRLTVAGRLQRIVECSQDSDHFDEPRSFEGCKIRRSRRRRIAQGGAVGSECRQHRTGIVC
jgi:hypothetical protein